MADLETEAQPALCTGPSPRWGNDGRIDLGAERDVGRRGAGESLVWAKAEVVERDRAGSPYCPVAERSSGRSPESRYWRSRSPRAKPRRWVAFIRACRAPPPTARAAVLSTGQGSPESPPLAPLSGANPHEIPIDPNGSLTSGRPAMGAGQPRRRAAAGSSCAFGGSSTVFDDSSTGFDDSSSFRLPGRLRWETAPGARCERAHSWGVRFIASPLTLDRLA